MNVRHLKQYSTPILIINNIKKKNRAYESLLLENQKGRTTLNDHELSIGLLAIQIIKHALYEVYNCMHYSMCYNYMCYDR